MPFSPRQLRFIVNPRAGTGGFDPVEAIRTAAAAAGIAGPVLTTNARGHATELARAAVAEGCDAVVAVGGDGTINEVARALIGTPVALGLVPRGSGNGFARHLRVPLEFQAAVAALTHAEVRSVDTGLANGHVFLCAMGIGFDVAVVQRFEALPRRGFTAYLGASAVELWRHRPESVSLVVDGTTEPASRPLLIAIANAAQFGNGAVIAPGARLDDGRLDLVRVAAVTPLNALPLVWRLFRGTLDRSRHVAIRRGTGFVLQRERPGPMQVDGELVGTDARIAVSVRPGSLRVLAPADRG